jgi:PBP1b-binding outer membrane lipoprotein LpoB
MSTSKVTLLLLAMLLTGCVAPRSELTVQVEQQQNEKPSVVVAFKATLDR